MNPVDESSPTGIIPDEQAAGTSTTSLNGQIVDSISAIQNVIKDSAGEDIPLMIYQIMVQSAALAMLNAVNQQQQMYILQNAVTTAAAKAALESKPEEAVKIINDAMKSSNVLETFKGLKNFMDDLTKTYNELKEKTTVIKEKTPGKNSPTGNKHGKNAKTK